jgi:hypothetical protein
MPKGYKMDFTSCSSILHTSVVNYCRLPLYKDKGLEMRVENADSWASDMLSSIKVDQTV